MAHGHLSGCRNRATYCVRSATLFASIVVTLVYVGVSNARDEGGSPQAPEQLLDEAAKAKASGQPAVAYALLRKVVSTAPDNSLARWQLGQVKVGSEWLSVEEAQRRAEADPRQIRYQERKESLGDSTQAQLALARWCRGNKLEEEAKVHLASVLAVDPKNKEALRAAQMRWHDGQLRSVAEIKEKKQGSNEAKQSTRRWASLVAGWMRALANGNESPPLDVLDEIRAVDDVAAIPAFEDVTLRGPQATNGKNVAVRRLSLAFLSALNKMKGEGGTKSLVRHAVMSSFGEVRSRAIADLRYRPLEDFVPMLLDNLEAPMKTQYRVVNDADRSVHYSHLVYREGPFQDWAYRTERSIYQPGSQNGAMAGIMASLASAEDSLPGVADVGGRSPSRAVSRAGAARSARTYEQEITSSERQIAEANEKTEKLNERIVAVLNGTTEQSYGNEPRQWWDWWQDYTDYYRTPSRPVSTWVDTSTDYIIPPQRQSMAVECFVRGTPVWTKTGQRPIESLQTGDLVLSQNVNTGEIRYKPVLSRTLRPAGPTVQVSTDDEKFRSTRGHPLWVAGVGWRMTKELEDGAVLQSLAGTGRVTKIDSAPDAETYNLVVADFNTYFIGSSGILAHDNMPRQPTRAVLPGIVKK